MTRTPRRWLARLALVTGIALANGPAAVSTAAARPLLGGADGHDLALVWSTYLGGTGDEADIPLEGAVAIAVDGAGNVYVAGTTTSADFPTTPGAVRTSAGGLDVFVTKLSPAGAVVYSTYLGGSCDDVAHDIAVDPAGNAYVTGRVNGGVCWTGARAGVLVAKLGPTGAVVYSSVIGGSLADSSVGHTIAVDAGGHAYVAGTASDASGDFPTTPGAYRTGRCTNALRYANDGFVAKVSADGSALEYSTFLCGSGDDVPTDIAIDAAGDVYVGGVTASSDFPTVNALQDSFHGGPVSVTGFVAKLAPDGASLVYSTYLGGSYNEYVQSIAIDGLGAAYVTGVTQSEDFPTTPGALQEHAGNRLCLEVPCTDAFVAKIDPSGSALVYSTYLFGELDDGASGIAVDGGGNAYVVGATNSAYFPIRGAFQPSDRGLSDAFVAELDPTGARLVFSTYLGGSKWGPSPSTGDDQGTAIALDAAGHVLVAGYSLSYDFPTTPGAFQPAIGNGVCDYFGGPCGDAFVAQITTDGPATVPPVSVTVTPTEVPPGGIIEASWAGLPTPTATDDLRLQPLGDVFSSLGTVVSWWLTTGTAGGTMSLKLPDDVAPGTYELRLQTPDAVWGLPSIIARSEPIRVSTGAGTLTPTGAGTRRCEAGGPAVCDDGDPCTVDQCGPGGVCRSTPESGLASVTCTCRREGPAACAGETLPASIVRRQTRACGLFADAAAAPRRLRKASATLGGSIGVVSKARKSGKISTGCADALKAALRDAKDRAGRFLKTLGAARR